MRKIYVERRYTDAGVIARAFLSSFSINYEIMGGVSGRTMREGQKIIIEPDRIIIVCALLLIFNMSSVPYHKKMAILCCRILPVRMVFMCCALSTILCIYIDF